MWKFLKYFGFCCPLLFLQLSYVWMERYNNKIPKWHTVLWKILLFFHISYSLFKNVMSLLLCCDPKRWIKKIDLCCQMEENKRFICWPDRAKQGWSKWKNEIITKIDGSSQDSPTVRNQQRCPYIRRIYEQEFQRLNILNAVKLLQWVQINGDSPNRFT